MSAKEHRLEKARERARRRRETYPGYQREWYEANREHVREYNRAYRAAHREKRRAEYEANRELVAEQRRRWRAQNRERFLQLGRMHNHLRRARKLQLPTEPIDLDVVLVRDCGICGVCNEAVEADWQLDHIVPVSKGGPHLYSNVQVAHPTCNMRKGWS